MNKRHSIVLITFLLALTGPWSSCKQTVLVQAGEYPTPTEQASDGDWPVAPIAPLQNPDRGYHLESGYFAHDFVNPFNTSETYPDGFIPKRTATHKAENDGVTLTQLYIYLTEWVDKDISAQGLSNIQSLFDGLRQHGHKAILRFAYNYTGLNTSGGESERWIRRHIEQLQPLFEKNTGLIATIQIGFMGAWGEWHNSPLQNDQQAKNNIVGALLAAFPAPYFVEIRSPFHKNALTLANGEDLARIGYANDYFTAGEHSHAPGNDFVPGDDWYKQVATESPHVYISGEIPYAEQTEWGLFELINTTKALNILRDHHYSAFDITQNFELNITSWKQVRVAPSLLAAHGILFSPDYFKDGEGRDVARSYYEFVRDHLGYRLNLTAATLQAETDGGLSYDLSLTNTGFATVLNPKPVYLVFIDQAGNVAKEIALNDDARNWQPFDPVANTYQVMPHSIKGQVSTGLSGEYRVGIWMPEEQSSLKYDSRYAVKWATSDRLSHWQDPDGKYAVNIVGSVTF